MLMIMSTKGICVIIYDQLPAPDAALPGPVSIGTTDAGTSNVFWQAITQSSSWKMDSSVMP